VLAAAPAANVYLTPIDASSHQPRFLFILTAELTPFRDPAGIQNRPFSKFVQLFWRADLRLWSKPTNRLPRYISDHQPHFTRVALPTASRPIYVYRFLPICCPRCLVDLSSITAEWPDVQLSFDYGGGRFLPPVVRRALIVCG
jgi:hypothetical protein